MERTPRHFQEELEALQTRLLEMGGLAEERARAAVQGLVSRDAALIDRYREATIALGYSGDSILNSASDITMMAIGFLAARRLPVWVSVAVVVVLEIVPLLVIRDNLTLNVWMLLAPSDAVRVWQAS